MGCGLFKTREQVPSLVQWAMGFKNPESRYLSGTVGSGNGLSQSASLVVGFLAMGASNALRGCSTYGMLQHAAWVANLLHCWRFLKTTAE